METKKCTQCGRNLPLTEYYSRGGGKLRSECKQCHNAYVRKKYAERKNWVNDLKFERGCQKCGEKRPYVLDFHHIDPDLKDDTIARIATNFNKKEDILTEINKCVVLCANCHREFHYLEEHQHITLTEFLS